MKVSVVVCTKNEERNIGRCLESLLGQKYPREDLELIVVDNKSVDRTRSIARQYTENVYRLTDEVDLAGVKNFRGAQLNFGASKATGGTIFYPDADMTFDEGLVKEATGLLEKYDALYVPEVVHGRGLFGKIRNFERGFYNSTCVDAVRFVKKSVFEKVGGFDEKKIVFGFDDWDFTKTLKKNNHRLGSTVEKLYHHEEGLTLGSYLAKKREYAKTFESYIEKWGGDDPDVRRQFSPRFRFLGVFIEGGKWRRLLSKPHLALGMFCLRILVGVSFLSGKMSASSLWRD